MVKQMSDDTFMMGKSEKYNWCKEGVLKVKGRENNFK